MSTDMYATVLKKTPVAASAHIESAEVIYDAITEQGHADATEAVKVMMDTEIKTATRYAEERTNDVGVTVHTAANHLLIYCVRT